MRVYTCRILYQLKKLIESYPISQTPQHVIRDTFGCSIYPSLEDAELSFSPQLADTIELMDAPAPNLTITLPETLAEDAGITTQPSLAFCGYKTEALFVRRESYLQESDRGSHQLSSGVASAALSMNITVTGLNENNIRITFIKNQVKSSN